MLYSVEVDFETLEFVVNAKDEQEAEEIAKERLPMGEPDWIEIRVRELTT